jgi:sugar phosphate permease|tara:strand:- start:648 stop:1025 length:378 start_codon:yes stop_codon:yes gene_type:complete
MVAITRTAREITSFIVWGSIAWAMVEILARVTDWSWWSIAAFFAGAYTMFIGLTVLGYFRMRSQEQERRSAMDQFIRDQKADTDKQAQIDREIIDQLRNEHELTGTEQDRRLKALEAALKHLRGK